MVSSHLVPLDLPSEILLIWEQPGHPQTDFGAWLFKGALDSDALAVAWRQALRGRPTFSARMARVRHGLFEELAWRLVDAPAPIEVFDDAALDVPVDAIEARIHERMRPIVTAGQNLELEPPVRLFIHRLPHGHAAIIVLFHHVATDGGGLYDFVADLLARYHRLVTGRVAPFAGVAALHAQAVAPRPIAPASVTQYLRRFALDRAHAPTGAAQMASTPDPDPANRRMMIRRIIGDERLQAAFRERARREGGTLSDLALAASKLALEEWNSARGAPPGVMAHGVAVNQRARRRATDTAGQGNPMSAIIVASNAGERGSATGLLRRVVGERIEQMDLGMDVRMARIAAGAMLLTRALPVKTRHAVLRPLFDMPGSFFLTNLGIVWPEIIDGKPTGETMLREAGGLELLEIHGSVGTTPNNALALILRTFRRRLYLTFAVGGHKINRADGQAFADLVVSKMLGYL
ncbi:hypothetical protein K8I61_06735 [bacterium]|nr:hypothetical protein [bacterium]